MEKVSGSVFDTTTLPKFLNAQEMAETLRKSYQVPVTEKYLREIAGSGHCPAFYFQGDLTEPLFIKRDVVNWMRESAFYQHKTRPTLEIVVNPQAGPVDAAILPPELVQIEGLQEIKTHDNPCVYFLVLDNVVVYVGASLCVAGRVKQHDKDKRFDRAFFLPVPKSQLARIERSFIENLRSLYNKEWKVWENAKKRKNESTKFTHESLRDSAAPGSGEDGAVVRVTKDKL